MLIYLISKIIPLFILPLGISIILGLVGLIWKKPIAIFASIVVIITFSLGIVAEGLWRLVEMPWTRINAEKIDKADAIVVLSGARHPSPGKDRIVEWLDPDRFLAGIKLFKKGKAPKLFFTGGKNPLQPNMAGEGFFYVREAIELGIPADSVMSSSDAINTQQEALAIKKLFNTLHENSSSKSIILVTSAFHMKRAKSLFERNGLIVKPFPVDFQARGDWSGSIFRDPLKWVPTSESLSSSSRSLREILGRLYYGLF